MKTPLYLFSICLIFISCQKLPVDVEEALLLSGKNRQELEKVLIHFKGNKLGYQSACFLIANMRYNQSKQDIQLDSAYLDYFATADSLYHQIFAGKTLEESQKYQSNAYDSLFIRLGGSGEISEW